MGTDRLAPPSPTWNLRNYTRYKIESKPLEVAQQVSVLTARHGPVTFPRASMNTLEAAIDHDRL